MICPDDLLIAARRGALGPEDQAKLEAHLERCDACRATWEASAAFDAISGPRAGDEQLAGRWADMMLPAFAARPGTGAEVVELPRPQATERRRSSEVWRGLSIAAGVLLALFAGAGVVAASLRLWAPRPDTNTDDQSPRSSPTRVSSPRAPEPLPVLEPQIEPAPAPVADEPTAPEPVRRALPSAEEMFSRANSAKTEGRMSEAAALYRQLQHAYPRAPEATVSFVSLGRVHLASGQAREALTQFQRYLERLPRGPLAEEALFGRASALERLGRASEERQTWDELLRAYPSSLYAGRARARMERLRAP
jgi:tetratricopeptide (TPR) repeat protein